MAFTSLNFLLFIASVILVYFLVPKKYQWVILLLASYAYYWISANKLVVFLLFTTITTFYTGRFLGKSNEKHNHLLETNKDTLTKNQKKNLGAENKKRKKLILWIAVILNFGILAVIKYFNFFAGNFNALFSTLSINTTIPTFEFLLPLGISFYTFQSVGYVIDVYRGKIEPDRNIARFALFVSFFPQIVQGPISRYSQLASQLYESHQFEYTCVKFGAQLILWGFFKKMVIADRLAATVGSVFDGYQDYAGIQIFIGAVMYSLQVYCDFSGGIDIARGIAQIMGIDLAENFKRPFFAESISDFWRRWHISLSTWMRDYIFYPLSLSASAVKLGRTSRKILGTHLGKLFPTFLAMLITFLVVGIWHGASWKYVAYGLYNGVFIFAEVLFEPLVNKINKRFQINPKVFSWRLLNIIITFFLVSIGRYFSRAISFKTAVRMLYRTVATFDPYDLLDLKLLQMGMDPKDIYVLGGAVLILFIVGLLQERGISLREKLVEQNLVFRWSIYIAAIFSILVFGIYGIGFDPVSFIYMGF